MSAQVGRRALLLGGVAAGLTACGANPESRGTTSSRTRSGSFRSRSMGGARTGWAIAWPKGAEKQPGLPVVLSLHGRDGSSSSAFSQLHLDDALDDAVAAGVPPFAVVAVDGGDHSYWHRRADGTDPVAMIVTELLPLLESKGLDVGRLALHGWSMGGYGALLVAGRRQLLVRGVAVSSPALFTSAGATPQGAFDDAEDFAANDVYGHPRWLKGLPVRIDCGTSDPFYEASRSFAERLRPRATTSFTRGEHDAAFWRTAARPQLRFLGGLLH